MLNPIMKILIVVIRFLLHIHSFSYYGTKIVVPRGLDWRSRWQIHSGKYEVPEITALQLLGKPRQNFLEIGGGAGIISTIISNTLTPERHEIYEALDENVHRINQQKFRGIPRIVQSAVVPSDYQELKIKFFKKRRIFGSGILRTKKGSSGSDGYQIEVPAIKLCDIDIEDFDVILVDVEGAEDLLLPELLPRLRGHLIFEFHPDKCTVPFGELVPQDYFKKLQYISGSTFVISADGR